MPKKPAKPKAAKLPPLAKVPPAPGRLGQYGCEYWRALAPLLVKIEALTAIHLATFEVLCETWQTYRDLGDWIDKNPKKLIIETAKGYLIEHPNLRLRQQALGNLKTLWPKFGLTPEALARLGKHGGATARPTKTALQSFAETRNTGDPPRP